MNRYKVPKSIKFLIIVAVDPLLCLHRACRDDNTYIAKIAITNLLRIKCKLTFKRIARYCANSAELIQFLIDQSFKKIYLIRAIRAACINGNSEVIKLLKHLDPRQCTNVLIEYGHLHFLEGKLDAPQLEMAVLFGQFSIFKKFAATPLFYYHNYIKFASETNICRFYENTPLNEAQIKYLAKWAAINNSIPILSKVIRLDEFKSIKCVIQFAAQKGNNEILSFVWHWNDIAIIDNKSLIIKPAVKGGHLNIIEFLLKKNVKFSKSIISANIKRALNNGHFHLIDKLALLC